MLRLLIAYLNDLTSELPRLIKHPHISSLCELYRSETQPFWKVHLMIGLFEELQRDGSNPHRSMCVGSQSELYIIGKESPPLHQPRCLAPRNRRRPRLNQTLGQASLKRQNNRTTVWAECEGDGVSMRWYSN